jgi:hypothetical protein
MKKILVTRSNRFRALWIWGIGAALLCGSAAHAQTPNSTLPPPDVQKTLDHIGDLDILKALNPLKLTAEQIEKIVEVLKSVAATGETKRKEDNETFRALAAEVAKARESALQGGEITTELEQKVIKAFGDVEKRFTDTKKEAVNRVYGVTRPLLTDAQKEEIDRQVVKLLGGKRLIPREYQKDPKKAPKEVLQDMSLAYFIERILLFDRTRDLLTKIKPAEAVGTSGATASPADTNGNSEQKP